MMGARECVRMIFTLVETEEYAIVVGGIVAIIQYHSFRSHWSVFGAIFPSLFHFCLLHPHFCFCVLTISRADL